MNPNPTPLKIEYLDACQKLNSYSGAILPQANLIIWIRNTDDQDHGTIHCLRDHQLPELNLMASPAAIVVSIARDLLEIAHGYASPPFDRNLFSHYGPTTLHIDLKKQQMLQAILDTISEELSQVGENHSEIVKVLVTLFLLRISECCTKPTIHDDSKQQLRFVKQYLDLVHTHFLEWRRVADYADHLCVTPNYLNAKIKKATGYTAGHHIQQRIILEAKRQALRNGLRMKEVAHYLGFEDSAHFSKYFKNGTGVNFTSYIKADSTF